jgi:hypothetical protein
MTNQPPADEADGGKRGKELRRMWFDDQEMEVRAWIQGQVRCRTANDRTETVQKSFLRKKRTKNLMGVSI